MTRELVTQITRGSATMHLVESETIARWYLERGYPAICDAEIRAIKKRNPGRKMSDQHFEAVAAVKTILGGFCV